MSQWGARQRPASLTAMRLHLDEDADAHALLKALRDRGLDVTSSRELGLLRWSDEQQLTWAFQEARVIYTYNAADFCRLHSQILRQQRHHAGIIIGDQQTLSLGDEMRKLLKIGESHTAVDLRDRLEFLSNWTTDN